MEISNLARELSHGTVDEAHARHKRALGEDYNGDDGQVLVDDTTAFQANIDTHLDNIPNSKLIQNLGINNTKEEFEVLSQAYKRHKWS